MSTKRRDNKGRLLRNGEVQRADGKYMYRYVDVSGVRRSVYSWRLVETDAIPPGKRCLAALRDIEKTIANDLKDAINTQDANTITLDQRFDLFLEIRTDLQTTTRVNYRSLYDYYVKDRVGYKPIGKFRYSDIQKLYLSLMVELGLKPSTVQGVNSILYQVFESAVMDSLIRINPCSNAFKNISKTIGTEREKRHALTEEEQSAFIEYVYSSRLFNRWGNLFTVLLGTGMRIGEALGLRWVDCDFENDLIYVNHGILYKERETGGYEYRISSPKTKAGTRLIPMFDDVKDALLRQKERQKGLKSDFAVDGYTGFIFLNNNGKVFTPGSVFETLQNITEEYNREEYFKARDENRDPLLLPKISAHIFRHTFCTRMCENEQNLKVIQEVMGHKNSRTTMDVYSEATVTKKVASFKSLEGKIKIAPNFTPK